MEHLNSGFARFSPVFFNRLFTAADENLPLSMVRVKNKPQHLVFWSHFVHLLSKPGHLAVESPFQSCWPRVSVAQKRLKSTAAEGLARAAAPLINPSPGAAPVQDAGLVQIRPKSVQVVDIRDPIPNAGCRGPIRKAGRRPLLYAPASRRGWAIPLFTATTSAASWAGSFHSRAQTQIPWRGNG